MSLKSASKFMIKINFCNIIYTRVEFNCYYIKTSFVDCSLQLEHEISLFPNFDPIQMVLGFPKFSFYPKYFENLKGRSNADFKLFSLPSKT